MTKATALAADEELDGITELEKFDPDRVDGVNTPASGLPFLVIKAAQGGVMDQTGTATTDGGDEPVATEQAEPEAVAKDDGDRDGDGENAETSDKDNGPDTGDGDDAAEKAAETVAPVDDAAQEPPAPPLDPDPVDLVKAASPADRDAYLEALATHRGDEPVAKGAVTGTDYLRAKADWRDWSAFGEREGLDGTEAGARHWLAKHGTGPVPPLSPPPPPCAMPEPVLIPAPEAIEALFKAEADVYKRDIDTATRRKLASEHKALPDGSYPIETAGDLDNAAHLARSGHGNVSGAKALIRRRAKELGVSNPLDDNNQTKKDAEGPDEAKVIDAETFEAAEKAKSDGGDAPKGKKCPTCKGSGTIRGGGMKCPACKGKGVMKPGKAAKTAAAATAAVKAAQEAGLLTEEAAAELITQIESEAAKAAGPGARPVPADTLPVPEHREPDGPYIEGLEADAGLPTDPDHGGSDIPASVEALAFKQAPYEIARMHDALCAAYDTADVLAAYPAMKGVADAVDEGVFAKEAVELLRAGEYAAAGSASALAAVAKQLLAMPPAAVADGRALVHKSFQDMYPDEHIKPQQGVKPGSYTRPYLSAGHAAASSSAWTVNAPPSSHVPQPQDYQRGYLSAGHAAPSPADNGPNNPSPPGSSGNEYYSTAEKDMAAAAMRSMHDHLAANYAGCCPMAPARHVMPPGMGATSAPETAMPRAQGGVATVKAAGEDMGGSPDGGFGDRKIKGNKGSGNKKILKTLERALRNAGTNLLGPAEVEAIIAAKLAPITEAHNAQVADLTKQVEELGAQPDPAMAPVRGQMARAQDAPAAPVEKRSLIDEAQAQRLAAARREDADFADYVLRMSKSGDPKTREAAYAVLDGMSARDGDAA